MSVLVAGKAAVVAANVATAWICEILKVHSFVLPSINLSCKTDIWVS